MIAVALLALPLAAGVLMIRRYQAMAYHERLAAENARRAAKQARLVMSGAIKPSPAQAAK
jgi:hypothetical protein